MDKHQQTQAQSITLFGALIHLVLSTIKLFGGIIYNSHALVADGFNSLSDLLVDVMVMASTHFSHKHADFNHPYGHQRIETATTMFLALILVMTGAGIAWDAIDSLIHHVITNPSMPALYIALASTIINEGLFRWTKKVNLDIGSSLIEANAWHHRSDALSALVVTIGIAGSIWGIAYLDTLAALVVALLIIKTGWAYGLESINQLIDTSIDTDTRLMIEKLIESVPGVTKIHQLRSRYMGKDIFIDVHILVSPFISVSEGHYIAQNVHYLLVENFSPVRDVIVHVDPEDDEVSPPSINLPDRSHIENEWIREWKIKHPEIQHCVIHYLEGILILDLYLDGSTMDKETLLQDIHEDMKHKSQYAKIRLFSILSE